MIYVYIKLSRRLQGFSHLLHMALSQMYLCLKHWKHDQCWLVHTMLHWMCKHLHISLFWQYIVERDGEVYAIQSNYESGVRILHVDESNGDLTEVGYFDCLPHRTTANFAGTWSNYPYDLRGGMYSKLLCSSVYSAQTFLPYLKCIIPSYHQLHWEN